MAMADWRSGKRRRYTEAFKRQVVAEASGEGVSAASVARRHGLNANLIFNWRRRIPYPSCTTTEGSSNR